MVDEHLRRQEHPISRRSALTRGALALVGLSAASLLSACASGRTRTTSLPEPVWPVTPRTTPRPTVASHPSEPVAKHVAPLPAGVISRSAWAKGPPIPTLMDPMLPVRRITLHHDGMTVFTSTSYADAADRLEAIRHAHRSRRWGDIGYHFLVDPAGRIWQGRPLTWQGAHVKDQNEGNLGVCVLGNYERQFPNRNQLTTVQRFVAQLMDHYNVGVHQVYTHRELAPTLCPGSNLQPRLVAMRSTGGALHA